MKVLVSYGYGAGWATWAHEKQKEIAEYKPIIDFIEAGGDPRELTDGHPLVMQMKEDLGLSYFYTGGVSGLEVVETSEPYAIEEYDGAESLRTAANFW